MKYSELKFGDTFTMGDWVLVKLSEDRARCEYIPHQPIDWDAVYEMGSHWEVKCLTGRLSDEKLGKHADDTVGDVEKFIRDVGEKLLPSLGVIQTQGKGLDTVISLKNWGISIQPEAIRRNGNIYPGWSIYQWEREHNYPHSPDVMDYSTIADVRSAQEVAQIVLKAVFDIQLDGIFTAIGEAEYAKSLEYEQVWEDLVNS